MGTKPASNLTTAREFTRGSDGLDPVGDVVVGSSKGIVVGSSKGELFGDPPKQAELHGALTGLKVIDAGVLFAGPLIATLMADFGADVIKVEHPRGDSLRTLGWQKNGVSLWWALVGRNKRCVSLDLSKEPGQEIFKELVADADVVIESFRPGTMERWGLGYETLRALNPGLVMVRVSGFGQTGPYSHRAGFGTVAESMSGFAQITGLPDGPPTLPSFALGDGVAALFGTFAVMFALHQRAADPAHKGQWIDLSLFEPLFWILGPQATAYDQLGIVQERTGNRTDWTVPRNAYQARDGRWVGLSASSSSMAARVMGIVGREDLARQPWFVDHSGRLAHQDELDEVIAQWMKVRSVDEITAAFDQNDAAVGPIYSIKDIFADPQYEARDTITRVHDERLGDVRIQNAVPRLSATPGSVRFLGRDVGADNYQVLVDDLGHTVEELREWDRSGITRRPENG